MQKTWRFPGGAQVWILSKFGERVAGLNQEPTSHVQAGIFTEVNKVLNEVAPGSGPYGSSAHSGLTLLSGTQESEAGALDLSPVTVRHFGRLPAGVGFIYKSFHTLGVNGDRPRIGLPKTEKKHGGFLKEFITTAELSARHSLIDAFFEFGRQCHVDHTVPPDIIVHQTCTISRRASARLRVQMEVRSEILDVGTLSQNILGTVRASEIGIGEGTV